MPSYACATPLPLECWERWPDWTWLLTWVRSAAGGGGTVCGVLLTVDLGEGGWQWWLAGGWVGWGVGVWRGSAWLLLLAADASGSSLLLLALFLTQLRAPAHPSTHPSPSPTTKSAGPGQQVLRQ